jgi:hypothetical protein
MYCYSVLMTFMYFSTNELERKPAWQNWVIAIFWPLILTFGVPCLILWMFYAFLFKLIPRWYRQYKWLRSAEYKEKLARLEASLPSEG